VYQGGTVDPGAAAFDARVAATAWPGPVHPVRKQLGAVGTARELVSRGLRTARSLRG
jgi:hypothetical protein